MTRLALVTGASRGIGAATAEALASSGYHVVLTARTSKALEEVEERIHASGGSATIAPLDLTQGDAIARLADSMASRWDALDLLVLNAAMLGSLGPVAHIDAKEMSAILTLNVSAQAALLAAFDGLLRAAPQPQVVGLTSSVARDARAFWGAYAASKAGFEALLLSYAEENRNVGRVAVAIVDPGATRTAMRARAYPGEDPSLLKGPGTVAKSIASLVQNGFETGHLLRL